MLTNCELLKPGVSFRDFAERCWRVPDEYVAHRYMMMIHGAGLVDEYPTIVYRADWNDWGYDATFEQDMVVSVESFIGEIGGKEGIKLEEQVLITHRGAVPMSKTATVDAIEV